jgi:TolB-like protein
MTGKDMGMKTLVSFLLIIFLSLTGWFVASAKDAKSEKVAAVLPFTTCGVDNRAYTQQVIAHIFSSPLNENSRIKLIFRDDIYKILKDKECGGLSIDEIYTLGKRMGADYVIYGTVNPVGESLGISVELIDIGKYRCRIALSAVCHGMADAEPKLKAYAHRIEDIIDEGAR